MSAAWRLEGGQVDVGRFHLGPVDLELAPGRSVAVLGTSGAGKTTLLRALAGFLRIRRGHLTRDGVDVTRWLPEERGLGYVPQGLGLFPHFNVEQNVRFPLDVAGAVDARVRTRSLLERFRLTELARRRPAQLSGGEQQRVAIARAIAADPALLVWDEPWQGLDVVARHELGLALHDLQVRDRVPLVVVTHDPALAFGVADELLVLRSGAVRRRCSATELLRDPGDAFAARFVGYENVYEPSELVGGAPDGLRAWLRRRAGADGLAVATPEWPSDHGPRWSGTVRSARPGPAGVTVEALADELLIRLRMPTPVTSPIPGLGSPLEFALDERAMRPLGPSEGAR